MRRTTQHRGVQRAYMAILGGAALVAALAAAFAATLAGTSSAAVNGRPGQHGGASHQRDTEGRSGPARPTAAPGPARSRSATSTAGTAARAPAPPDASDCQRISNASDNTYVARQGDAGFRLRVRVIGRNADGQDTATSNPTAVITSAGPTNTREPTISGTATVGNILQANRGEWTGAQPITYSFIWLRCNAQGDNCSEIPGANDTEYEVRDADSGRTLRVRVTATERSRSNSAISNPTGVVGGGQPTPPPTGQLVPVGDLQAAGDRLVIASVNFSPNPVTSRTAPITARVKITARGGRPVSGAPVFMRATPRVVQGQTQTTRADGFVTLTLVPNQQFPQPRSGFNVQFFVKAYRPGDPGLGGIAGYRLVQVRLAG